MGLREKAVLASVGMVVLYAIAVGIWFVKMDITSKQGEWNRAQRKYREACTKYRSECRLISEKYEWSQRYDEEKSAMPSFSDAKAKDTTWMGKIGEIAKKHNVELSNRKSGKEVPVDDVLEIEIECSWEASLQALVGFMHELENTSDGMFDFRSISFKPSKKGYLKGTFVVNCAYMREVD